MSESNPLLRIQDVWKSFGITQALKGVSMSLEGGLVYGLVGENGAGKSTLVKSICGAIRPDSGQIVIDGHVLHVTNPQEVRDLGISTVFQELSLIPDLSLAENMQLQRQEGWLAGRRNRQRYAEEIAEEWGLAEIRGDVRMEAMSLRDQQLAEILCAISRPHRVLIMDEPTSALLPTDVEWLEGVIRRVVEAGSVVLIITHMFDEIERFCDETFVQRNGEIVDHVDRSGFERRAVIETMIGRSLDATFPEKPTVGAHATSLLEVESLTTRHQLTEVSLTLRAGEIVGIAGLDGQGQEELFDVLSGAGRMKDGEVRLRGRPVKLSSPARALRPAHGGGLALVPAERKTFGTILDLSIRKNVSLPVLRTVSRASILNDKKEDRVVRKLLKAVHVDEQKIDDPVRSLSGGNQQKVVFAKALSGDSEVLLLFDPTRGVDVGTKYEIYRLIGEYAERGNAVLMYSTEIPEVVNVCHRALVIYRGRIVDECQGEQLNEKQLMASAIGISR